MTAQQIRPYELVTQVFVANQRSRADVVINQGGTSSGKTIAILQLLLLKAVTEQRITITVVAGSIPDLKSGALRDARRIVAESEYIKSKVTSYNVAERIYVFASGSVMEFKSYEDEFTARSGKRDYLFINEAQNVKREIFDELFDRTYKQTYLDYNPTARFWAHDLISLPGVELIVSNFKNNPRVNPKVKRTLLGYRNNNPARWRVYGLGLTGEVEGAVFQNCQQIDTFPNLDETKICYGLDFGFSNDPTACVKLGKAKGALYGKEILHETGLSNAMLADRLLKAGVRLHRDKIVADSADPKAIQYLKEFGFWIVPAKKGPDSVRFGVTQIHDFDGGLFITSDSTNWWIEQENYLWQKKNGKFINIPIDKFNHLWDAARYAVAELARPSGLIASG